MTNSSSRPLALITGGAVRLGAAISTRLANMGYRPVIHAHSHFENAQTLAKALGGEAVSANLMEPAAIDRVFAAVDALDGPLEVLVNNAAIFQAADPLDVDLDTWQRHLALNLTAPFYAAQQAARRMRTSGRGVIVNLLDIAALRPEPGYAHYSATKAGLESLTRGLAVEWAPVIRVNGVAPGAALLPPDFDAEARALRMARTPMGVEPGAEAVADAVAFLVDGPSAVTGVVLPVDGGMSATW
ncbi:MAG: SDR family oxidoreductase [Myxococcota bacterium]|nr:SDR family oxidoreductase [Myxococcota bacterium]